MTLGWGIVGLGRAADTLIAPAITKDPNSRLVAAVSRDAEKAKQFAERHGAAKPGIDYQAMIDDPEIDVVAITSPNALHAEQGIAAARAGKHVFMDKPMAMAVEDAEKVLDACANAGVRIGMDFQTRHHACFEEAKSVIDRGEIGDVMLIQAEASPGNVPFAGWRMDPDLAGLGAVNNIAVHMYDLVRFLTGAEVTEVAAMFDTGRAEGLERLPLVLLRFDSGALGYVNAGQMVPNPLNDIVIYGSLGRISGHSITRPQTEGHMSILTASGERRGDYNSYDCYDRTVAAFSKALIAGRDPNPSGLDGLRNVQLTDAIRRAAREGRTVPLAA
jgi:1,5-anhydro-D-fructose reductase (1,5-anhydro-D-mannitol-forming)